MVPYFRNKELGMISRCIEITKNYPDELTIGNSSYKKRKFKGGRLDGYLEDRFLSDCFDIAVLTRNGNTWMSITPMEIESHITHIKEATGNVLVAGLGMGYYITQIVHKQELTSVTVIEKDIEVIEAYNLLIKSNSEYFSNNKLKIIHGDLFDVAPKLKDAYDYAYFDIWLDMDFDLISEDFEKLNDLGGINANKIGFWGMERFVCNHISSMQWNYTPEEMSEMIKDEIVSIFGENTAWIYLKSIELMMELEPDY